VDLDLVIDEGLQAGEIVVTEGQLRLQPGSEISSTDGSNNVKGGGRGEFKGGDGDSGGKSEFKDGFKGNGGFKGKGEFKGKSDFKSGGA
jgi:hypothetical protein